jgi:hypothetical protein
VIRTSGSNLDWMRISSARHEVRILSGGYSVAALLVRPIGHKPATVLKGAHACRSSGEQPMKFDLVIVVGVDNAAESVFRGVGKQL